MASDTAGRNAELTEYLSSDDAWLQLTASLDEARAKLDDLENEISQIGFYQRERQIETEHMHNRLELEAVAKFGKHVAVFSEAVHLLADLRGHRG